MNKESLFELIRKEEVVIWAGAGLSLYAGYPSGKRLTEIFYNTLSNSEKKEIKKSHSLPEFTETLYRIRENNNSIIQILKDTFLSFIPISIETHEKIASIPHFKTIITTNYDELFEKAYGLKGQVAFLTEHIPYLKKCNTNIFKIHGDLSKPETIIIKTSDYENFTEDGTEYNIFWTSIKERISTNSILFLGYNIEDSNTRVLFNRISKALGEHRKPCFMIAPNLSKSKINDLKRADIYYINSTAENFIDELINNIKKNIYSDFENHRVSVETLKDFVFKYNVVPDLKVENGIFKLQALKGINGVNGEFKFTVKSNEAFIKELNDFILGKKVGEFILDSSILRDLKFDIGGINYPIFESEAKLIIKSIPYKSLLIDFKFENGFEFVEKTINIFGKYPHFEVHFNLKSTQLLVKFDFTNIRDVGIKMDYKHNKICVKIKDEIEELTFLNMISAGNKFKIYWDESEKFISHSIPKQKPMVEYSEFYLEYFNLLRKVENHFELRFNSIDFETINQKSYDLLKDLVQIIEKGELKYNWDGVVEMVLYDNVTLTKEDLKKWDDENVLVVVNERKREEVELHNQKINLGYMQVKIENPYVSNLEEFNELKDKDIKIKSKSKNIIVSYNENLLPDIKFED